MAKVKVLLQPIAALDANVDDVIEVSDSEAAFWASRGLVEVISDDQQVANAEEALVALKTKMAEDKLAGHLKAAGVETAIAIPPVETREDVAKAEAEFFLTSSGITSEEAAAAVAAAGEEEIVEEDDEDDDEPVDPFGDDVA